MLMNMMHADDDDDDECPSD